MAKTAFDIAPGELSPQEGAFLDRIRAYGWTATNVFAEEHLPGFSYTTGFYHSLGAPDLIVFSLPSEVTNAVFWQAFEDAARGERFMVGQPNVGLFANEVPVVPLPVVDARFSDHLTWTRWFHLGEPSEALQLVWASAEGLWPWSEGADAEYCRWHRDMTDAHWAKDSGFNPPSVPQSFSR